MKIKILAGAIVLAVVAAAIVLPLTSASSKTGAADTELVKRGAYLVTLGGCNDCHTPKVMTAMGPMPDSTRLLSGHQAATKVAPIPAGVISMDGWVALTNADLTAWAGPWGVSFAINLTPDNITGTGAWTEDSFIKAMRTGKHLGMGRAILPPMPWFNLAQATDADLKAIFAYLKAIKPIENAVPQPIPPAAPAGK
jgi:mono/diheme cytochrome c family protein